MRQGEALRVVGEYAADQWGLVTAAQAKKLGVDGVTLTRLVNAGLLTHVTHGVYGVPAAMTVGHLAERAVWLRLAADRPGWEREPLDRDGGVVSHRSAASVHDLGDLVADAVEITVPRRRTTRDSGVRLRVARLTKDEVTRVDGLPITTVDRTIVDLLADRTDGGHVGDVLATAHRRQLVDLSALASRVARFAPAYGIRGGGPDRGTKLITRLLEQVGGDRRGDHDRQLTTVASQLAALDPARLHGISQLLQSIGPDPKLLHATISPGVVELMRSFGGPDQLRRLAQQITEPVRRALASSEPLREMMADVAEQLRPLAAAALPEESRRRLAEGTGLLAAAQIAAAMDAPAGPSDEDGDTDAVEDQ